RRVCRGIWARAFAEALKFGFARQRGMPRAGTWSEPGYGRGSDGLGACGSLGEYFSKTTWGGASGMATGVAKGERCGGCGSALRKKCHLRRSSIKWFALPRTVVLSSILPSLQDLGRGRKRSENRLTWRIKSEIIDGLEVSHVPSSFPIDAAIYDAAPLRTTTRNTTPTFLPCSTQARGRHPCP